MSENKGSSSILQITYSAKSGIKSLISEEKNYSMLLEGLFMPSKEMCIRTSNVGTIYNEYHYIQTYKLFSLLYFNLLDRFLREEPHHIEQLLVNSSISCYFFKKTCFPPTLLLKVYTNSIPEKHMQFPEKGLSFVRNFF